MRSHYWLAFSFVMVLGLILSSIAMVCKGQEAKKNSAQVLETPRSLPRVEDLGRASLNQYGSFEAAIQTLRSYRPLDLK